MLARCPKPPKHIRLLQRRQYEQWRAIMGIGVPKGSVKLSDGFKWHCWDCGKDGILGVDGFGAKGVVRPRNILHEECFENRTTEERRLFSTRDRTHEIWRRTRRYARRNLDRESMRRRYTRG